ncbi:MAG TPA: hypothetical protein VM843_01800, partial [Flavisolibacter sp.]|nr:hypothetical protein [Flavisolibacter sp.]
MIIGITTDFITGEIEVTGNGSAHYEVISQMAAQHPEHRFHLLYATSAASLQLRFPPNVSLQKKPGYKHPLLQKLWYDVQLIHLLKKHQVDVLLSMEGYSAKTSKIPQCLLM